MIISTVLPLRHCPVPTIFPLLSIDNRVVLKHKKRNLKDFDLCGSSFARTGSVRKLLLTCCITPPVYLDEKKIFACWSGERLLSFTLHHTHLIRRQVRTTTRCVIFPRPSLDEKVFGFWHRSIFVFIWQTLSNYGVTRLRRFVFWFTSKLCN